MHKIRQATIEDLEAVKELNTKAFAANPKWDPDAVRNWASTREGNKYYKEALEDKDGYFVVCEEGGKLIGYANGTRMEITYRKSKYFEIVNLGVVPEKRRSGVGKALLEEIAKWAKAQGYEKLYLDSYIKNKQALEFYKKNGFQEISISLEKNL